MELQSGVKIKQEWDIVAVRQLGREIAKEAGFSAVDQARIATAISELARNIYLYTDGGLVTVERIENMEHQGISVIATDDGPGMDDVSRMLEDGYTTSRGLGAGLPGVKRLMDEFDMKSDAGNGTEVKAIKRIR